MNEVYPVCKANFSLSVFPLSSFLMQCETSIIEPRSGQLMQFMSMLKKDYLNRKCVIRRIEKPGFKELILVLYFYILYIFLDLLFNQFTFHSV